MPSNEFFEGDVQGALEAAVESELTLFGEEVVEAVVRYIRENGIDFEGDLAKSMIAEVTKVMGTITVSIGPTVRHGLWRHEGTKPHWAPIDPLRNWVRKKLGLSAAKVDTQVSFSTKDGKVVEFTAKVSPLEQAARALQAKIAAEGTKGDPYLSVPFNLFRGTLAKRVGERIEFALGGGGAG